MPSVTELDEKNFKETVLKAEDAWIVFLKDEEGNAKQKPVFLGAC